MPAVDKEGFLDFALFSRFSLDKIQDWITWISADGGIMYVNDAACTALGYTKIEIYKLKVFVIHLKFGGHILTG